VHRIAVSGARVSNRLIKAAKSSPPEMPLNQRSDVDRAVASDSMVAKSHF